MVAMMPELTRASLERVLSKHAIEMEETREHLQKLSHARAHLIGAAVVNGMSQRAVAELLGITHTAVQKIMRDHPHAGWCSCPGLRQALSNFAADARAELRAANRVKNRRTNR